VANQPARLNRTEVFTLTANEVDVVTLGNASVKHKYIEVSNRGPGWISFTTNGTDPTADGAEFHHVGPGSALQVESFNNPDVVKLVSSDTSSYSVEGTN
jgi:hypothetical protein